MSCKHSAATIGGRCRIKESTCRRHLEDLMALEILDREGFETALWGASEWIRDRWAFKQPR